MAKVSFYLDVRHPKADGTCALKLVFRNGGTQAHLSTGYSLPEKCWDGGKVVSSRSKSCDALLPTKPAILNNELNALLAKVTLFTQQVTGKKSNMSAPVIKAKVKALLEGKDSEKGTDEITFLEAFEMYLDTISKEDSKTSMSCAKVYVEHNIKGAIHLQFDDIDEEWCKALVIMMQKGTSNNPALGANTIVAYLSSLKCMWKFSQKKGYVSKAHNPWLDVSVSKVPTKSRALEVETLRKIWYYVPDSTPFQNEIISNAVDFFKLSFILCGLNPRDLWEAKESDIMGGRLMINRQKTGVPINVLIPPEGWEIINRHKKDGFLIGKLRGGNPRSTNAIMNVHLKKVIPGLTMYYARHSWMSLGAELDIPDRVLFMGIAHKMGKDSDETYITMRHKKLDVANRKILDFVQQKGEFAPIDNTADNDNTIDNDCQAAK